MLGWMLAVVIGCASARAEVVDRILHVVGTRVICASEVAFERTFAQHDSPPVPVLADPLVDVESRLVDYAVLRELAGDASIYRPDSREVRRRFVAVRDSFATPADFEAFLAAWGLDEPKLQGFLSSRMAVERYVQRNFRGDVSGASDEWQAWMTELRARAGIRSVS